MKTPIDLSAANMNPYRIKEYAFNNCAKAVGYQKIDNQYQSAFYLLKCADIFLYGEAGKNNSIYFSKMQEEKNKRLREVLDALVRGDPIKYVYDEIYASFNRNCYEKAEPIIPINNLPNIQNYEFPFLALYGLANDFFTPRSALISIFRDNPYKCKLEQCSDEILKSLFHINSIIRVSTYNSLDDTKKEYCTLSHQDNNKPFLMEWSNDFTENGFFRLFNSCLLDGQDNPERLRPVFVVDRLSLADKLEREMREGYINYLFDEIKRIHPNFLKHPQEIKYYINGCYLISGDTSLACVEQEVRLFGLSSTAIALGDAIVTAPVGGFAIPEYSSWTQLANRDIYIFKFGERDELKFIQELLDVTAAIYRDIKEDLRVSIFSKINYVIMPENDAVTVNDATIHQWKLEDLFDKTNECEIPIPDDMKALYDEYCRKFKSSKHADKYVVNPFLKANKWMLLSGEEGSGKSYLAMALGCAIAANGKLPLDWKTNHNNNKVLYIADDEMDEYVRERLNHLRKIYPRSDKRFFYEIVHRINLLEESDRLKIEDMIHDYATKGAEGAVNVLILDHLNKLSQEQGARVRENGDPDWRIIRNWIEELGKRKITVILLHHEYTATGKMLGSRFLGNDTHAHVSLKKVDNMVSDIINFSVSIPKNKGGASGGSPIQFKLNLIKHKWEYGTPSDHKSTKINNDEHDDKCDNQQNDFRRMSKEERTHKVEELRKDNWTVKKIAEHLGCSLSSVQKIIAASDMPKRDYYGHGEKK